jgi:hypothetical protein
MANKNFFGEILHQVGFKENGPTICQLLDCLTIGQQSLMFYVERSVTEEIWEEAVMAYITHSNRCFQNLSEIEKYMA